jgi:hypothetical protein
MNKYFLTWSLKPLPKLEGLLETPYTASIDVEKEVEFGVWSSVWNTTEYKKTPYTAEVDSKQHRYRVKVFLEIMGREMNATSTVFSWDKNLGVMSNDDNMGLARAHKAYTGFSAVERVIPNVLRPEYNEDTNLSRTLNPMDGFRAWTKFDLAFYAIPEADVMEISGPHRSINNSLGTTITRSNGSSIGN